MTDADGREYIDCYLGSASLTLGHAHPEVVAAVCEQVARGAHFFELTPATLDLAQLLVECVPSAERVKYAMSGTEAIGAGVRAARAATGKDKFVKFEGAYHGSNEWMLWGYRHSQPLAYPRATPDSHGIPHQLADYVLIAPYNDLATATQSSRRIATRSQRSSPSRSSATSRPSPGFSKASAR
jgi:glutamate-1-semialdehyde 2,1-aminomutase